MSEDKAANQLADFAKNLVSNLSFQEFFNLNLCSFSFFIYYKTIHERLTDAHGAPVGDRLNSLTAGPRGPILLQDTVLVDELSRFDRERIPERVVHAKGAGAFGYFECTHDITKYTKAVPFEKVGKRTPVVIGFSCFFNL